ncbi:hypothetical protein D3C85_1506430 [compost metagenome]
MPRSGRPPAFAAELYPVLVKLAHAHSYSSQAELARAFLAETGITAHPDTFAKALKLAGITGLLLAVSISAASVQDRDAADDAVAYSKEKYPSLHTLFVDSA